MGKFSWKKAKKPFIVLAPMAGITDSAFRQICKKFGADLVCSEMISSNGIVHYDAKTMSLVKFKQKEKPIIIQIFGKDENIMAEAATILENKIKPDGIDINFGCPARKVISSGHGAALMDNLPLAEKIVKKVRKAVKLPLSVKCRLGAKNKNEIFDFASIMESAGVDALVIHGRTLKQGFKGKADWEPIYKVKKQSKIVILGNGDLKNRDDIKEKLGNSLIDGLMIGRGALGNPFIFSGNRLEKKEIFKTALEHANLAKKEKGERGIIEMRKHLAWYIKGIPDSRKLRRKLVQVKTIEDIKGILNIK